MRRFLSGALALALSAALCLPAQAAAGAEIIRAFVYDGTLYTYMSIDGTEKPVTKAEVKIGGQTFAASGRLETVRQAGSPVTCLLLVDNSNSMPAFRQEAEDFAESLAQSGGENSRFILAAFGIILPEEGQEEAPEEIRTLADQRWQAKQNRDWTEADRLRAEVAALGWVIKDRKDGYDLARK